MSVLLLAACFGFSDESAKRVMHCALRTCALQSHSVHASCIPNSASLWPGYGSASCDSVGRSVRYLQNILEPTQKSLN
jgi:hypothetical protein